MKCKECGKENWEIVIGYLRKEEVCWIHLFQCKSCKRCVVTDDSIQSEDGEL